MEFYLPPQTFYLSSCREWALPVWRMRNSMCTEAGERGEHESCCADAVPAPWPCQSAGGWPEIGLGAPAWCCLCSIAGVGTLARAEALLEGCSVHPHQQHWILLQGEMLGREGISLRQKCADLRLNFPPGSAVCLNQSNKLLCPVPCTLQLLCPSL